MKFAYQDLPAGTAITFTEIDDIVQILSRYLIVIAFIVMVMAIVWAGIIVMTAQSDTGRLKVGLTTLRHAIYGAAIVMATGVIINTVTSLVDRTFFCQISVIGICLW